MRYEKATAEIIIFDNSDVITTSGNVYCNGNFDGPGHGTCGELYDQQQASMGL